MTTAPLTAHGIKSNVDHDEYACRLRPAARGQGQDGNRSQDLWTSKIDLKENEGSKSIEIEVPIGTGYTTIARRWRSILLLPQYRKSIRKMNLASMNRHCLHLHQPETSRHDTKLCTLTRALTVSARTYHWHKHHISLQRRVVTFPECTAASDPWDKP